MITTSYDGILDGSERVHPYRLLFAGAIILISCHIHKKNSLTPLTTLNKLWHNIRELIKPRRRRQQERDETKDVMSISILRSVRRGEVDSPLEIKVE